MHSEHDVHDRDLQGAMLRERGDVSNDVLITGGACAGADAWSSAATAGASATCNGTSPGSGTRRIPNGHEQPHDYWVQTDTGW
eukprot:3445074-Alexandrium_andersonii.AAC.1